jgi:hypothetical protein
MTSLVTGLLLGAGLWGVYTSWLAPIFGWPVLFLGLFLLTVAWLYLVIREPVVEG